MTDPLNWVPEDVDVDTPSAARLYDYLLDGSYNFEADRALAARFMAALPGSRDVARLNRAFLRRAVLFLLEAGVRQFLDIGSGIPTAGNVHEVAQHVDPAARVVYVDNEPVAVAHSQLILEDNPNATVIKADLTEPESILHAEPTRQLLDFSRPIGLLMVGVFHFVPLEADAAGFVRRYREVLAPGSYLAMSHFTADSKPAEMASMVEVMRHSANPIHPRSRAQFAELFADFELVEPGIVPTALWRPEAPEELGPDVAHDEILAGVGRWTG
ncbi:SAM-dependent methyltransferase [Kutzneria viridogrisea]|uniref:S-adenosyl methyltransferase n=2 Tax=Kutzneria TaxID=43356 RepID=W5WTW0_9PSEU|nr:SAM-dependent methyltransferase [Kutzneria albida]AHI01595.1 hypothetical protein KALB_8237 [Kutzneria albida DSM 43870]MBA8931559.1 hypothetical protein [Kutzneria viridogrisea]